MPPAPTEDAALATILDTALDAVIRMDAEGIIIGWNVQAAATFGWSAEEAIGRSLADTIIPPQHREAHQRGVRHFLTSGEGAILNRRIEITALDRSGRELPVELTVTPVRIGGEWQFSAFVRDLTTRNEAERARHSAEQLLRESEERYRLLFEANPEPMWVYDSETRRFLAVNDAAVRRYGFSREEFLSLTIMDIRSPAEHPSLEKMLYQAEGPSFFSSVRHVRKDGSPLEVEVVSDELRFAGRPARLVLARDVSERRQLEARLRQAQKMEAVGQLAGGIAHDFNNLLTAILGSAELLLDSLPPDHPGREEAGDCRKAALRAADLTRQLLAFSSRQVLAPKVLRLNDVVADLDKMLRRIIGEHVDLRTDLSSDLGAVQADRSQLEQVLVNLAVNARDAMPSGGKLTIATANAVVERSGARTEGEVLPGAYVKLVVSDTGIGMGPDVQARAFEPFFTTKPAGKGTGLGLATVYGIVKQSGGHIGLTSTPGEGTTFSIHLPRVEQPVEPAGSRGVSVSPVGGSETVLLVEDQEEVRSVTRKILGTFGYQVLVAASGAEALELVRRDPRPIQILVTDVVMPGMNGRELSRRLLQTHPTIRVVFLSGYPDDSILEHGVLEPGVAFLQKPFSTQGLARKVREVLDA